MSHRSRFVWSLLLILGCAPSWGQDAADAADATDATTPKLRFSLEAKAHLRQSAMNLYPSPVRTVPASSGVSALPPKVHQSSALETVSEGTHFEISTLTLYVDAEWSPLLAAHAKIDAVDLYDRNPTSTDKKLDVDEVWLRFGRESEPATLPPSAGGYAKIGKFPKFERQNDRHLESYGLIGTSFNRFEDAGLEVGVDLGRHVYLKGSATQGNPVFIRDPNALAGDNGVDRADPALHSGIPILYDAEIEDVDLDGELELGAGLGVRWADAAGRFAVDVLAWGFRRDLAERVELEGTLYPADLGFLRGPVEPFALPIASDTKEEFGANVRCYLGGFAFFGQYVDQDLAGIPRLGYEAEAAWSFELPLRWAVGGRQLFPAVAPAVRYSRLDREIVGGAPRFPYPSVRSEWEKVDVGLRLGIVEGVDLTAEYADHRFIMVGFVDERPVGSNNEFLATLRWRTP